MGELELSSRDIAIQNRLDTMREGFHNRCDPVRFRYLESMFERLKSHRASVRDMMASKLLNALEGYSSEFLRTQEEAQEWLEDIAYHAPEKATKAQELFDQCEFQALRRMFQALEADREPTSNSREMLTALVQKIKSFELEDSDESENLSLADRVSAQDEEVLSQYIDIGSVGGTHKQAEPRFVRQFREASERSYMDDLVTQSLRDKPENPGPINPHMLAIRSLEMMRDLSPAYLSKFVSYVDSLFWIESVHDSIAKTGTKNKDK